MSVSGWHVGARITSGTRFASRVVRSFAAVLFWITLTTTNNYCAEPPSAPKLLIAYASYKDRGKYPTITFYEHDGNSIGKVTGTIPSVDLRSDSHPSLSHDGRYCAFTSELENFVSRIFFWDMVNKQLIDLPVVNDSTNSQQHAALSGDGGTLAFACWSRPGLNNRWDIFQFNIASKQPITPAHWNANAADERMPALNADGRWMAFVTNAADGRGGADISVWDRLQSSTDTLSDLNSPNRDVEPSLSADGRLIAFVSDRPGGSGGRDIYLYDRETRSLIPLPGLNSIANEQMPSITPDGRFLAFVSERLAGAGERDVFLYDRATRRLLPTPDLNSKREEIDPCVILLP